MQIWQIDPASLTPYYDLALCEALADARHQVRYVTSRYLYDAALNYPQNVTLDIHYFQPLENSLLLHMPLSRKALRGLHYPLAHLKLLAKLRQHRPDVVHMQWSRLPTIDRWLLAAAQRLDLPVVHTIHDVESLFNQEWLAGALEGIYTRYVDHFIVHAEENRERFLRHYPLVPPERVDVIPMLPLITKREDNQTRVSARAALGIDPSMFVVMCFGIVKHYKGIDLLIDAIPMVASRNPKIQFWIVGRIGDEASDQFIIRLSQFEQVQVRSEYVPSDELWKFHLAADVMLFPYRQISQSAALATSLSYGCAVIVTDVGGLPSLVQGNGWIIPTEQPHAIAEAVLEAAQQPEKLAMMRELSKAIFAETLSPAVIARKHIDLYERMIARRKRS